MPPKEETSVVLRHFLNLFYTMPAPVNVH